MTGRVILAELNRSVYNIGIWCLGVIGIGFTCLILWGGDRLPEGLTAEHVPMFCDGTAGGFTFFSLFCLLLGGMVVTGDYSSSLAARQARLGPAELALVLAKVVTTVIWCAIWTTLMVCTGIIMGAIRLATIDLEWQTSHHWGVLLGGNLIAGVACGLCGAFLGFLTRSTVITVLLQLAVVLFAASLLAKMSIAKFIHPGLVAALAFGTSDIAKLSFGQAVAMESAWVAAFLLAAVIARRIRESQS